MPTNPTNADALELSHRLALALEYIRNNPDRTRGFRPYFSYHLLDKPAHMLHTFFDTPHVAGRFLDAIHRAGRMGLAADAEVEAGLTGQLFGCLGPDGLGYAEPGRLGKREAILHDQRELLLGLISIMVRQHSGQAYDAARKLVRTLQELTETVPDVPGPVRYPDGTWGDPAAWDSFRYAPANLGRMVTALNHYYVLCKDAAALELAQRLVDYNLAHCFFPDGTLRYWAGYHLHSVTGLVESIAEFGLLVNDHDYVRRAKAIYDHGLRPYVSDFGWVKENLANASNDGEANNTGDVLRTALLLGKAGYPEYYQQAERMLRNHLLASQLLDVEWIRPLEDSSLPDDEERTYRNIAERARGGFGFTTPNDWVTDQVHKAKRFPLNADIVQGSVQAIVACCEEAVTRTAAGIVVNLLLTRQTPEATVVSHLPHQGRLEITLHAMRQEGAWAADNLLVRIPTWASAAELAVWMGGQRVAPGVVGGYLLIPAVAPDVTVTVELPLRTESCEEIVNYRIYAESWVGDTLVALQPAGDRIPLYTGLPTLRAYPA